MSTEGIVEYHCYQFSNYSFLSDLQSLFASQEIMIMGGDNTNIYIRVLQKVESEFLDLMSTRNISNKKIT